PPSLINPPKGCRFRPRCPYAKPICAEEPPLITLGSDGYVRCWLYGGK
ncbi:MAG: oligopeptide ABC transporter ATP-binding protein, partial [Sulfolobales archaeon]